METLLFLCHSYDEFYITASQNLAGNSKSHEIPNENVSSAFYYFLGNF